MSWLFSRALAAEYSAAMFSVGELSAPLNVMPTPHKFSHNGKTMDCCDLSRFGLTCEVLTEGPGAALLTWYLAGFPAKTLAPPGTSRASTENAADYGRTWFALFATYDRVTHTWKTQQRSLFGDLAEFSGTWPRSGLMLNGACSLHPHAELFTSAKESGFWPTPYGFQAGNGPDGNEYSTFVRKWAASHRSQMISLGATSAAALCLHPCFVEAQMGWPIGWTALEPLETVKFHEWQQQHFAF